MRKSNVAVLRTILLGFSLLFLVACSRVEFVYDRADWFVARWAANYLDLDRDQRRQVRDEVATYREFHRQVRVPEIRTVLNRSIDVLENGRFERDTVLSHLAATESIAEDMTRDLLPLISEVLSDLDDHQRATLREQFAKRRGEAEEARAEYAEKNGLEGRQERMRERAEDLLGSLNEKQKALLDEYVATLPETAEAQLAWESDRQKRLLALLEEGASSAEVKRYLQGWWLAYEDQPADLQRARAVRRELTVDYLLRFLPTLDAEQTGKLIKQLESYASDLEGLL